MKVGIYSRAHASWTSGGEYTRAQAAALVVAPTPTPTEIVLVSDRESGDVDISRATIRSLTEPAIVRTPVRRVIDRLSREARLPSPTLREWRRWADAERLDVLLSFWPPTWWKRSDVATCTWIPDFQHMILPEMFSPTEVHERDEVFLRWVELSELVVLSSNAMMDDFAAFAPKHADKGRVFRFPSRFAFEPESLPPADRTVLDRWGIDEGFILVANQFFRHKNHETVIEAAGLLHGEPEGCPQIVMIGQPTDYRDPGGEYMSGLLAGIAERRLEGRVKILGFVSAEDRDALVRCCRVLLQPSRSEGWNTSVEDAKAIGRPVIASDLPVHREQLPDAFGFFAPDDAAALAALLRSAEGLPAGPDQAAEELAMRQARVTIEESGCALYDICEEAVAIKRVGRR